MRQHDLIWAHGRGVESSFTLGEELLFVTVYKLAFAAKPQIPLRRLEAWLKHACNKSIKPYGARDT